MSVNWEVPVFVVMCAAIALSLPIFSLLWNKAGYWHARQEQFRMVTEHMKLDLEERKERRAKRSA